MDLEFSHIAFAQSFKIAHVCICSGGEGRIENSSKQISHITLPKGSLMTKSQNQMWGGRFAAGQDAIMEAINASIGFDQRMAAQDIQGSRAHAAMLGAAGIISNSDSEAIREGLLTVLSEIDSGDFPFRVDLEDIHMNVEQRLKEVIGEPAGRLHTGRSRNDQVATDFRLWVRDQTDGAIAGIEALMKAFLQQARAGADWVMPGFTHLQTAQPVTWGHHMMAYVEMLARDKSRFEDARRRMNESPLGAAALAGTSFPIDRDMTAAALGFDRPAANSLDAVQIAISRWNISAARASAPCTSVVCRRAGNLVVRAISLCNPLGSVFNRLVDHAAEEKSRCCGIDPGEDRPDLWRQCGFDDGDERLAADLFQGHARGQRAGL